MSIEAWTIIGTGVALAALNLGLIAWLRSTCSAVRLLSGADGHIRLEERILAVEKEQARTSGLLEGFGLTGRASPDPGTAD